MANPFYASGKCPVQNATNPGYINANALAVAFLIKPSVPLRRTKKSMEIKPITIETDNPGKPPTQALTRTSAVAMLRWR